VQNVTPVGGVLLGSFGVLLAIGIPMLVVGAPVVQAVPEADSTAVYVQPILGPTGAGLRVAF
jgi:hypothetical protein